MATQRPDRGGPGLPGPITIVLADDHEVVRTGLRMLLDAEPDFEVVAEAGNVIDAARRLTEQRPRILVLGLNLPGGSGLAAIPSLLRKSPDTRVVVLAASNEVAVAREALQAGVTGFVLKESGRDDLVGAVRLAAEGRTYLTPELGARLAAAPDAAGPSPDDLSPRELEVLRLIALGHTNAEIAAQLYLSVRTVESHRSHIQQKTRRSSRAKLVAYARERGLL